MSLVVAFVLVVLAFPNAAAANCYPSRPNWVGAIFTGVANESVAAYRIHAEIEQYFPLIPTNANGTQAQVSAWVMLNKGGSRWMQLGWQQIRNGNGTSGGRWDWNQHVLDNGVWSNTYYGLAAGVGNFTKYAIFRETDAYGVQRYRFRVDGVELDYEVSYWVPDTAEWHAEINAYDSQMPGDVGDHVKFKTAAWAGANLVWHDVDNDASKSAQGFQSGQQPNLDHFGATKLGPSTYSVWDDDCPT